MITYGFRRVQPSLVPRLSTPKNLGMKLLLLFMFYCTDGRSRILLLWYSPDPRLGALCGVPPQYGGLGGHR